MCLRDYEEVGGFCLKNSCLKKKQKEIGAGGVEPESVRFRNRSVSHCATRYTRRNGGGGRTQGGEFGTSRLGTFGGDFYLFSYSILFF
ncbi:Protein CBG25439 [Caenorhabditis briggsae]|uniref:Protein CBG25439 n=1 Tax=Caenorhabditis briggsae TaxID=6238 RepID=B6ILD2_CAEBR|nr:Protein CBG25439 [Caenorhabditis briggsae]CAS00712.1 Protein CBG25439 [Caenorhabditis briggsae]